MHDDGLHYPLAYEVTELGKLRTVERQACIVIGKNMGIWDGIAFLLRQDLTCRKLGREGVPFVGCSLVETRA
jgi:hypothetical protein